MPMKRALLYCPSCGSPLESGDVFCPACGGKLSYKETSPKVSTVTPQKSPHKEIGSKVNVFNAFANLLVPRQAISRATTVVYEKAPLPLAKSSKLVLISIGLFVGFYFLYGIRNVASNLMYFIATYSIAIVFLYWVYKSDKYEKEPFKLVLYVFSWGVFSGIIAMIINTILGPLFSSVLGNAALVAPFVEEPVKAIGLYLLVRTHSYGKEFNTPLDGIVYGFSAGIGFFAMENFHYFLNFGPVNLVIRSFLCWGHGVWVATTGLWLAIAKVYKGRIVPSDLIPGLLVAIFLHFLWNGWSGWIGEMGGLVITVVQSIFHVWYLRRITREALRDELAWGYDKGRAPIEK